MTVGTKFSLTGMPDLERALGAPGLLSTVIHVFGSGTSEFVKSLAQSLDFQYILVQGLKSQNSDWNQQFQEWTREILGEITDWHRTSFDRPCVVADPGTRLPLSIQYQCSIRIEVSSDGTGKVVKNSTSLKDPDPVFRWGDSASVDSTPRIALPAD